MIYEKLIAWVGGGGLTGLGSRLDYTHTNTHTYCTRSTWDYAYTMQIGCSSSLCVGGPEGGPPGRWGGRLISVLPSFSFFSPPLSMRRGRVSSCVIVRDPSVGLHTHGHACERTNTHTHTHTHTQTHSHTQLNLFDTLVSEGLLAICSV